MCGVCSTYGGVERGFGEGDQRERSHLEDLGIDGKIILKLIFSK
jgi:hypothetical protein